MTAIKSSNGTILHAPTVTRSKWKENSKEAYWNRKVVTIDAPFLITPQTIWQQGESITTYERTGETETIRSFIRSVTVEDSSLYRRTTTLFWSIVRDMWVSFGSLTGKVLPLCLQNYFGLRIENKEVDDAAASNTNVYSGITTLRTQTKLKDSAVDYYCRSLAENNTEIQYIPDYLVGGKNQENPPNPNKFLIPIVLKGIPDHIVAVYITRTTDKDGKPRATIEFYDSKGLTIADRSNQRLKTNPDMTLGKLIAELADQYCEDLQQGTWVDNDQRELSIEENTQKQQWDSHNCGVYVCRYFAKRLAGTDRNTVCQEKVTYKDTWTWRKNIITALMPTLRKEIEENARVPDDDYDEPEDTEVQKLMLSTAVPSPKTPEQSLLSLVNNDPNTEQLTDTDSTITTASELLPFSPENDSEDSNEADSIRIYIDTNELVDVPL